MCLSDTQFFGVYAFTPVHKNVTDSSQSDCEALRREISVRRLTTDSFHGTTHIRDDGGDVGKQNPEAGLSITSIS